MRQICFVEHMSTIAPILSFIFIQYDGGRDQLPHISFGDCVLGVRKWWMEVHSNNQKGWGSLLWEMEIKYPTVNLENI